VSNIFIALLKKFIM